MRYVCLVSLFCTVLFASSVVYYNIFPLFAISYKFYFGFSLLLAKKILKSLKLLTSNNIFISIVQ